MSNISVNTITDALGGSTASINGLTPQASNMQPFNRIINGAMTIDQRNAGASVTANDGVFSVDRWACIATANGKFSMQQNAASVTPPAGFKNYLGCTSTAATALGATDFYHVRHKIEGFNADDLSWGTSDAKAATLSFWVRSSLTGVFGGSINNSAFNRSYPFSFTISSANTWEYKTVAIAGDTSGTWLTASNIGIQISFSLGSGSTYSGTAGSWSGSAFASATGAVSVVGTNGATFYITGVQLEAGSTASSFDYRPYGTELALCQRYFTKFQTDGTGFAGIAVGTQGSTTESIFAIGFPVQMRVEPTCAISNLDVSDVVTYSVDATLGGFFAGYQMGQIRVTHSSAGAQFRPATLNIKNNTTGFLSLSAEL
jgi:hypothetical protein